MCCTSHVQVDLQQQNKWFEERREKVDGMNKVRIRSVVEVVAKYACDCEHFVRVVESKLDDGAKC